MVLVLFVRIYRFDAVCGALLLPFRASSQAVRGLRLGKTAHAS